MTSKIDRAKHGPSWIEVILGAVLALLLGIAIGAALLVLRPVIVVREMPKEADLDPRAVYFVEGARDGSKAQALAKRKAFLEGQSIAVTEGELNLVAGAPAMSVATAAKAADPAKPAAPEEHVAVGLPSFRIREGALQMGAPVTVNVLGVTHRVVAHASGGFVKEGELFVYRPDALYLGSCPLQRFPLVMHYVQDKFLSPQLLPDDLKASWGRLANVAIEGNTLKLTMP